MKIITRYLLHGLLAPFIFLISAFCLLYIVFDVFDSLPRIIDGKLPLKDVIYFFALSILPYINWLLPASLMLATLYAVWQFSRNSELTAMRAGGISFMHITMPFLSVALIASLLSLANTEFLTPKANAWTKDIKASKFTQSTPLELKNVLHSNQATHRDWVIDEINRDNPNLLQGVKITQERPDGTREYELLAEKAEFLDGVWWLFAPHITRFDPEDAPISPSASDPLNALSLWPMPALIELPREIMSDTDTWDELSISEMIRFQQANRSAPVKTRKSRDYDVHSRLAAPWACIIITLFAIPTGIGTGRQGVMKGITLALGCFFAFYILTYAGLWAGKQMLLPAMMAAWLPNIIFLCAGIFMMRRLH